MYGVEVLLNEYELIRAIDGLVGRTYSAWTVGITENPEQRKIEHGNPTNWNVWHADSEQIARNVERYFLDKGCKGGTGGGDHPTYVYVF